MNRLKAPLLICLFIISTNIFAQNFNQNWSDALDKSVENFKSCKNTGQNNINPCSKFIGESVNIVYGVNDFYSNDLGRYLTGTEIAKFLEESTKWSKIGPAYLQENLNKAQELTNAKKVVIAMHLGEDNLGHVSIILPGELTASGSWGMQVPNSASFFMNSPSRSYANKGLSYGFTRNMIKNIVIYTKNY